VLGAGEHVFALLDLNQGRAVSVDGLTRCT
jgi:hypothetical protein